MRMQTNRPASRPMEHRWGERVTLDCPARLVLGDGSGVEGRVRNASISGAWIDAAAKLPAYTTMNVLVSVGAGLRRRTVELPACVVRTGAGGVAVEWRDMGVATLVDLLNQAGADQGSLRLRDHACG